MGRPSNKSRVMEVLKALQEKPGHANDIGIRTSMPSCTARRHLVVLHSNMEVHVSSWDLIGDGPPIRVYSIGCGIDAPNPFVGERRSGRERRSSLTTKSDAREFDNKVARAEARRWADRAAAGLTVDPLVAALFGIAQQGEQA